VTLDLNTNMAAEYNAFIVSNCGKGAGGVTVTSSNESGVTTATIPIVIFSTGAPVNATPSVPFHNGTIVEPAKSKTKAIVLPTETSKGNGTGGGGSGSGGSGSGGSGSGGSGSGDSGSGSGGNGKGSPSSPTQPSNPVFSGAAVSEFGNGEMATFAGFVGVMWLAFAAL
jgi:hypothetical protein